MSLVHCHSRLITETQVNYLAHLITYKEICVLNIQDDFNVWRQPVTFLMDED